MNRLLTWKAIFYLAAIFAAGSVSGWVLGAKTAKQKMLTPPPPENIGVQMQHDLTQKLELTPEQSKKVEAIFRRFSQEMRTQFEANMQRVRQSVTNRDAQIAAVLTPEQQAKFEELKQKRIEPPRGERGHRRPPMRGPGPGHPGPWRNRGPSNSPPPPGPPPNPAP